MLDMFSHLAMAGPLRVLLALHIKHLFGMCYDFERFRLFAAVILASRLRSSSVETKECL